MRRAVWVLLVAAACSGRDDVEPRSRGALGAECTVSTQCAAELLCIDGTCTDGACRSAAECSGDPGGGCDKWACVASRCVPGCFQRPDAGFEDGGPPPDAGTSCDVVRAAGAGDLIINELLADPAADAEGDANGDGTRSSSDDEFIEIGNLTNNRLRLDGLVLSDSSEPRHVFSDTVLGCGQVVAVFGGGDPTHAAWRDNWVVASLGTGLSLNNGSDEIRIGTSSTATPTVPRGDVLTLPYGNEVDIDESLTRETDLDPQADLIPHRQHLQARGARFSPGVRPDGSAF